MVLKLPPTSNMNRGFGLHNRAEALANQETLKYPPGLAQKVRISVFPEKMTRIKPPALLSFPRSCLDLELFLHFMSPVSLGETYQDAELKLNNPRYHLFLSRLTAGLLILLLAYGTGLYKKQQNVDLPVKIVENHGEETRTSSAPSNFSGGETSVIRYQATSGGQP